MQPKIDYLVLSRGQWDANVSKAEIEDSITRFYDWYEANVKSGHFKAGSRLGSEMALVSKAGIATDGPFGEAKEVIGGYWIIVAGSLKEAAGIAAQNPCLPFGLTFEIRPLESARASVYNITNETPQR